MKIVIGGGLAGLVAASALRKKFQSEEIVLLERNDEMGGLLGGSFSPCRKYYFDLGTHIFQETGNASLDEELLSAIPREDLIHFPVGSGDIAGAVFAGRLQENSHFPDVRSGAVQNYVLEDLVAHIERSRIVQPLNRVAPLTEVAAQRFGHDFAESVICPTLSRAYHRQANELSGFALQLPGWTRVVLDDFAEWERRSSEEHYRALVAIPNQRELPVSLHHGRRSFYSRRNGSRALIDGLVKKLSSDGVKLCGGVTITSMDLERKKISLIEGQGSEIKLAADTIVIATGVVGAAQLLGMNLSQQGLDMPMPHWIVDVVLEEACDSDLCYLYGFDDSCDWYRVTNYRAITGDPDDRRITIEVLGQRELDSESGPLDLVSQLFGVGFLRSRRIEFSNVRRLGAGFPSPTVRNMRALTDLGLKIDESLPNNVLLGGVGSNGGLFFQNEVVPDLYDRVLAIH